MDQTNLTPQQRMAQALMQQQATNDPQGTYSPMQGLANIANKAIAIRMMQQQPQAQMPFASSIAQGAQGLPFGAASGIDPLTAAQALGRQ